MTTEDRIEKWRKRREQQQAARTAHGDLPVDLAVIAAEAESAVKVETESADPIVALVVKSLRTEPSETIGQRRRVYDAIARGMERGLKDPVSEYAEFRRRQLRTIIRVIEGEARAAPVDFDADYQPKGLDEALAPLITGYRRRQKLADQAEASRARRQAVLADEAYTIAIPVEEEPDLEHLRDGLARLDALRGVGSGLAHPKWRAVRALLRYQYLLLMSESRLALVWTLIGPAVLIALLMSAYFISGIHTILNMDVPTFAMIGSTSWFMLRNIIFRTTASFHAQRTMMNLRALSPAMLGMTQGLVYMSAYSVVYISLIGVGHLIGMFTLPVNIPGVVFWLVCIGLSALALGVIFGSISVIWPYFPRFAPAIERALQILSSVILVSEQLPLQYRWVVLWSPWSHAEQLLRSAYFAGYKSEDASAPYFFICFGLLVVVAIIAQRLVRSRSIPA